MNYDRNENPRLTKKSTMYIALLSTWVLTLIWFNPRLFSLYPLANSFFGKVVLTFFILFLDLFWLFGSYYLMHFLFTLLPRKRDPLPSLQESKQPDLAILYVTLNDFVYEAALSCIKQDYRHAHLFILDDSTMQEKKDEVDRFQKQFPDKATVIRRKDRMGFKAGSVNNALKDHIKGYPYFAVIDSDGYLPEDFLKRLMPYFELDESIAFVQGSHRPNPLQKSKFANDLSLGIIPLWTVYYGPRNNYGFVLFLGHGAILRRDVFDEVGGFPEIVSEDLAFSTRIRELGYQGHYVSDVICYEDFPENYKQLRKQQEKYVKGGCEYIGTYLLSFLKAKKVPWFEKFDVLMSCATLFMPFFHLLFILLFSLVLSNSFGHKLPLTFEVGGTKMQLWDTYVLSKEFNSIWTFDFYAVTLLNMFAPLLGCIFFVISKPIQLIRLLFLSTVPFLSLMVMCTLGIISYLIARKAPFPVTGDLARIDEQKGSENGRLAWKTLAQSLNSANPIVHVIELIFGVLLSLLCLRTLNIVLLAFSVSMILGFFILKFSWENKILKPLLYVPFGVMIFAMGFLGLNLIGIQGVFLVFFAFHF